MAGCTRKRMCIMRFCRRVRKKEGLGRQKWKSKAGVELLRTLNSAVLIWGGVFWEKKNENEGLTLLSFLYTSKCAKTHSIYTLTSSTLKTLVSNYLRCSVSVMLSVETESTTFSPTRNKLVGKEISKKGRNWTHAHGTIKTSVFITWRGRGYNTIKVKLLRSPGISPPNLIQNGHCAVRTDMRTYTWQVHNALSICIYRNMQKSTIKRRHSTVHLSYTMVETSAQGLLIVLERR